MEKNSAIAKNKFVLGFGKDGEYSDIEIKITKSDKSLLKKNQTVEMKNSIILFEIESLFQRWINYYKKNGVLLEIEILNIGIDKTGRKYKINNSVNGIMQDILPKIGIKPPQIFDI